MSVAPENGYRNGTMYSSYTASSFARIFEMARHLNVNLLGIVSWAFEFEDQPWFHGFRDLATNGVDKPVLNVFRMFGKMGGTSVEVLTDGGFTWREMIDSGVRGTKSDIGAIATRSGNETAVLFWNYHDDDKTAPDAVINFVIKGMTSGKAEVVQYRIDKSHSNSYEVWKQMGSPQNPSPDQYAELERAGQLQISGKPSKVKAKKGTVILNTTLQRQGVGLIIISD
jgi:xylan 1,4-beta-xylosidase